MTPIPQILQNFDAIECVIWPGPTNGDLRHRMATIRALANEHGVDIGPGDCTVGAPELLRYARGLTKTGQMRQHPADGSDEDPDEGYLCGCEEDGWWCPDASGSEPWSGWSTSDVPDHIADLHARFEDEEE